MKRRNFLAMIGAAAATPALPAGAATLTPKLQALGVAHAHKYPMVSVMGLSRRMKIPHDQAQQVLGYLMDKGLIGKPGITGTGISSAASRVFKPVPHQIAGVKTLKRVTLKRSDVDRRVRQTNDVISTDWLAHLRELAVHNGFAMSPRAMGAA